MGKGFWGRIPQLAQIPPFHRPPTRTDPIHTDPNPQIPPSHTDPFTLHSAAKSQPIIAEPEVHGAQPLDGVTGFLVLMSEGLYKALEAAHGPGQANQVRGQPGEGEGPDHPAGTSETGLRVPEVTTSGCGS